MIHRIQKLNGPGFDPADLQRVFDLAEVLDPSGWLRWAYGEWLHWNELVFESQLPIPNIIRTLTPNGDSLGHYNHVWNEIALHPSTWDPSFMGVKENQTWGFGPEDTPMRANRRYASHVLLHEMIHAAEWHLWPELPKGPSTHRSPSWCYGVALVVERAGLPLQQPSLKVPVAVKQVWVSAAEYQRAVDLGIWKPSARGETTRETKNRGVRISIRLGVDAAGKVIWEPASTLVCQEALEAFPHQLIEPAYYLANEPPSERGEWVAEVLAVADLEPEASPTPVTRETVAESCSLVSLGSPRPERTPPRFSCGDLVSIVGFEDDPEPLGTVIGVNFSEDYSTSHDGKLTFPPGWRYALDTNDFLHESVLIPFVPAQ